MTDAWPPSGDWTDPQPQALGFDADALAEAVAQAEASETPIARDVASALEDGLFGEPWPIRKVIGPVKPRGGPAGVILRHGALAARWGDVRRVDMTFSATKSYLAICAGLAVDDGRIPDIHAPVRDLVDDGGFDAPQNREITWAHLLQLSSEWEGELWGKPDWVDHNRDLNPAPGAPNLKGQKRALNAPGTHWEYNDVRVNRLALALLRVWRRPLPEVLRERIMDPIGCSDTWEWHGYETSWVEIDGRPMQSVSGGAHWGGGMQISTLDHARVGQLILRRGEWQGRRLLSEGWIDACLTPSPLNPDYGFLWWLNARGATAPDASRASHFMIGVGANVVWVDPALDLVAVVRWIDKPAFPDFARRVTQAARVAA
ncbi:MAG: serine hydrolase [Pseudomonadota bacterium]